MRNAVIIPTRGRGIRIQERISESLANSTSSDFFLSIDSDDETDYTWVHPMGVRLIQGVNTCMNDALNRAALELCDKYSFLTFMGDDHIARTKDWDVRLMSSASNLGPASLAYGNDLLAGQSLPTAILVDSRFVKTLGFLAPTQLNHMFLDDFWLAIGSRSGKIAYLEDVILEHMHFSAGKSEADATYDKTNQNSKNLRDKFVYFLYRKFSLASDTKKIAGVVN